MITWIFIPSGFSFGTDPLHVAIVGGIPRGFVYQAGLASRWHGDMIVDGKSSPGFLGAPNLSVAKKIMEGRIRV